MLNSMIATVVLAIVAVLSPTQATAVEPYGGCAEGWQAPYSAGAADCRALGYTIRPRLVVGPHGVVRHAHSGVLHKAPEYRTYWLDSAGRRHWVWPSSPVQRVKGWVNPWHFVHAPLADALAESGYPSATTRRWERCITKRTAVRQSVICPNGFNAEWRRS